MNRDELLEEIQKDINEIRFYKEKYYPVKSLLALRAVVQLHKPIETTPPWVGEKYFACAVCEEYTNEGAYNSEYPCKTMQAIELEFN